MKIGAVLDVLIDVVDHVLGKGRRENAAIAQRAMAELGAPLAPSDDLVALQNLHALGNQMVFARRVLVNDLAVVEHRLDTLRAELRSERKRLQRAAARFSAQFFASEKCRTQRRPCIAGDRLNVNVIESAARLESAHQQNVQENAAGQTQRIASVLRLEVVRDVEHRLLREKVARCARSQPARRNRRAACLY